MCDFNTVYNNPSFFLFESNGLDYFSIEVTPIQGTCDTLGTSTGVQSVLLRSTDCNGLNPISDCIGECQVDPFVLTTHHIPQAGEIIVLVVDGCNGTHCDLSFNIISGMADKAIPPTPEELAAITINNEDNLQCGNLHLKAEPAIDNLCNYIWYFPNGETEITNSNEIIVNVNDFPNGEICVQAFNEECFPGLLFPEEMTICYDLQKDTISAMVYVDPTSCGRDDGFAYVVDHFGTYPFSYLWSNGGTSSFIDGISAGQYFVTITDAKGCEVIDSVFIAPSDSIRAEIEIVQPDCGESNGSIKVKTRGGFNMGYRYEWLPNFWISADSLVNLSTGIYSVTISDEYDWSCNQIISNIEIYEGLEVNIEEIYHSDMFSNNGFIRFSVENAVEFKYFLTTPTGILEGFDSIIGNLTPAKYNLEIVSLTDEDCQFFFEFVIKGFNRPSPSESIRWNHVLLFPNPVNDILYIEGVEELCSYELYNISGERLQSAALYNYSINLSEYPRSVYLLKIITINGESIIRKVVKM